MLIHARERMFHLERFAIQMLSSLGVGAFFTVIGASSGSVPGVSRRVGTNPKTGRQPRFASSSEIRPPARHRSFLGGAVAEWGPSSIKMKNPPPAHTEREVELT